MNKEIFGVGQYCIEQGGIIVIGLGALICIVGVIFTIKLKYSIKEPQKFGIYMIEWVIIMGLGYSLSWLIGLIIHLMGKC